MPLRTFFGPDLVHHDNTLLMQMSEGRLFKKPADMSFHQLAPGTEGAACLSFGDFEGPVPNFQTLRDASCDSTGELVLTDR